MYETGIGMSKIPELLISLSGEKIDSVEKWKNFRREEILHLFCEYVYGVRDIERPGNLCFNQKSEMIFKGMRRKDIEACFDDFSFPFSLYLPVEQTKAVPTFIYPLIEAQEETFCFDEKGNLVREEQQIPIKDITDRGFGIAVMPTRNVYPDWKAYAGFKKGVFAAVKTLKGRQSNSWATISAWAWGASRVLDYLETDKDVDYENVAVVGHSRGGKTALWAGATDERFKLTISNNSGCMGAAVLRGKVGEHVKNINISDWFCENFHKFNDWEEMLPVDQHMLIALMAPRYVYVTSSQLDSWADPDAEYLGCSLASEAFELYGLKGLAGKQKKKQLEVPDMEGHIAYHMKAGEHSITGYDWRHFMEYFERIIKS